MPVPASLSILLIESRGGMALALLADRPGFSVSHADRMAKAAGEIEAARAAGAPPFDAILLDLSLSDSQGLDAFRRAASLMSGAPVVALCRAGDSSLADAVISEGAQACLEKDGLDAVSLARALRQAVLRSRAEAGRFRALFDSAPIGILLATGRRVAMANPMALDILGYADRELAQLSVLDLFPEAARPKLEKALDALPGGVPEARFASELRGQGGLRARCRVHVKEALLNHAPAVALYLEPLAQGAVDPLDASAAAGEDAPDRVHLQQSGKMEALGRLAGGVAHDFNNLLTAINGYSEHLLTLPNLEGPVATGLKAIRRAGETAAAITRNLMAFSQSERADIRPVRVDAALREMVPMLQRLLGDGIDFRVHAGASTACVRLEPGQLEQIVLNLCVNARDAMPGGGVLTVEMGIAEVTSGEAFTHLAAGLGAHVVLSVDDTGTGMGPETLERLFEPFYTTKRGGRGTGLGLANVYGIVSQAGGGISVTSVPGMGSRFRIYLAREETPAPAEQGREAPLWNSGSNRETVLVVEDEPSLREMLCTILQRFGFSVLEATSAAEAAEAVSERPGAVDLVITDVMLRGDEGGHELAESLQALKPGLRTMFISGHSLDSLADRGIFVPADAFLEKPFSPSQLAAMARTLLDAARRAS